MRQRNGSLDLLRIVAALMVVMIHCSSWFSFISPSLEMSVDDTVIGCMVSSAVPLFFMISGCLLLDPTYNFNVRKWLKKILKVLIIWAVWGAFYAVLQMDTFSLEKLVIWTFKGHFHFWFFEYLIGVYLLLPVLRALVVYENGKYIKWFLLCWLLFGIVRYTLDGIQPGNSEIRIVTGKIHWEMCAFSGYYVLGYFLGNMSRHLNKWLLACVYAVCVFVCCLVSGKDVFSVTTMSFTLPVVFEACAIFLLFVQMQVTSRKWLTSLSSATLGVYLMHPLVLEHMMPASIWYTVPWIRVVLVWAYVSGISILVSWLMNRIPVVRKWLLSI